MGDRDERLLGDESVGPIENGIWSEQDGGLFQELSRQPGLQDHRTAKEYVFILKWWGEFIKSIHCEFSRREAIPCCLTSARGPDGRDVIDCLCDVPAFCKERKWA